MKKQDKRAEALARPLTRRQLSRRERELRLRRIIYGTTAAVVMLIFAILGYGYYREFVGKGDEPVATVGGAAISARDLAKAMGYYNVLYFDQATGLQKVIADNQQAAENDEEKKKLVEAANIRLQQLSYQLQALDSAALESLVEGEILRREAASRGYSVDQAARDKALVAEVGLGLEKLTQSPGGNTQAEPSQAEIDAAKNKVRQILDGGRVMSEDEYNRMILEPAVYRARIQAELNAQVPTSGEQVHAAHILVETEQAAKDALAMLQKGELDFAATAKQLSQDTSNKDQGGDLGWFPKGVMDPEFEKAAFALEAGQMSEPVQSSFGWHIIKVYEKAADRPLEPRMLEQQRSSAYQKWLSEKRTDEKNPVAYLVDASKMKWVQANMPLPAPTPTVQAPAVPATQPPASPTPATTPPSATPQP